MKIFCTVYELASMVTVCNKGAYCTSCPLEDICKAEKQKLPEANTAKWAGIAAMCKIVEEATVKNAQATAQDIAYQASMQGKRL